MYIKLTQVLLFLLRVLATTEQAGETPTSNLTCDVMDIPKFSKVNDLEQSMFENDSIFCIICKNSLGFSLKYTIFSSWYLIIVYLQIKIQLSGENNKKIKIISYLKKIPHCYPYRNEVLSWSDSLNYWIIFFLLSRCKCRQMCVSGYAQMSEESVY